MADNARGIHVSPGVYSREIELNYAVKSLGITTLGLVGETQRGPAFQPMSIENWRQFQDVFGGTSAEKFVASQYPKYELPYIAKSYLSESNQLEVCRVLGLSGFNAGPAWLITAPTINEATGNGNAVVAVIRSRANYEKYVSHTIKSSGDCACGTNEYDRLTFDVGDIDFAGKEGYCKYPKHSYGDALQMKPYIPFESANPCEGLEINPGEASTDSENNILVQSNDYGHFKLVGVLGQINVTDVENSSNAAMFAASLRDGKEAFEGAYPSYEGRYFEYSLSLNPADKDYILKVLGTNPQDGTAPIYVESLYDVAFQQLVDANKVSYLNGKLYFYDNYNIKDFCQMKPVNGFVTKKEEELSRKEVGKRYLCKESDFTTCHLYDYDGGTFNTQYEASIGGISSAYTVCGEIYTVRQYTDKKHVRHYYYAKINPDTINGFTGVTSGISKNIAADVLIPQNGSEDLYSQSVTRQASMVKNLNDNFYYRLDNTSDNKVTYFVNLPDYSSTTFDTRTEAEAKIDEIAPNKTYLYTVTYNGKMYSYTSKTDYDKALTVTVTSTNNNEAKKTTVQLTVKFSPSVDSTVTVYEKTKYVNYKEDADGNFAPNTAQIDKVKEDLTKSGNEYKDKMTSDGSYYKFDNGTASGLHFSSLDAAKSSLVVAKGGTITRVFCDMNNYKSGYRFASTPWIVSNLKGDYESAEVHKLFRFHTISDGNSSNNEIKVSIVNIRPDEGTFGVLVRKIDDTDASVVTLESFSKCNLIPGSDHYIGYLIGTYNGDYEVKSKYITVEINENLTTKTSAPAGFIGYPLPKYGSAQIYEVEKGTNDALSVNVNAASDLKQTIVPRIAYNTLFDEDVKHRRQYFGLSDITGVDIDLFTFKGNATYPVESIDEPYYLTPGFHLDSRIGTMQQEGMNISVEGITGYTFDTVSTESATDIYDGIPLIGKEEEMYASIFEYVDLRKFTVYFYGGFDGWDEFRDARTNTDDFKMTKYKGEYSQFSGEGYAFDKLRNPDLYAINEADAITSDYYAYLSAIRQFANPEAVDINVFATPGIDIINNKLLCEEAIDMIEEERADSIYIATIPDKPYGASDYNDDMYTPDDIVYELEETDIDSNYTCVYYPWVKYYDEDNYQYINLPVTKDVVRNMALTDNTTHPWFAPAGISRGDVSCEHAHYITSLADEDVLYEGRINPVKTFANDGVKLWGQKNLQVKESQLNRINVRRLLLRMRKLVAIACRNLIFEPNDNTTKASFLSTVTPILDNIKSNRGVSDYKIEVNDTVESRERRELPAKIYFKPINALEYISLDFIVTPEGVSFDNI